ncbi:MAG: Uncharacterized protein XD97_0232 [Pelotomaculum thermopropionicum]|uniref:N-acetyltransferase domain-containing protein n=1 Tax=Pelotomaculum thermopropionicum TaxID=110500 RepID=A0A101HUH0_9FIRM|nr:MAG: Uncharacterized protein XD97_0232 [Pelotomaculum thermopropionicum]
MVVEVAEAVSKKAARVFNSFPRVIYRNFYQAPDFPVLDRSRAGFDPFFAAVEAMPFLALKGGRVAGRIAAGFHRDYPGGETGFFGYFESLNDCAVARALLDTAAGWLAARGKNKMIGPVDLTPHERLGLLVEGFRERRFPGMPYNPPYYQSLMTGCGLEPEVNLFTYRFDLRGRLPDKLYRVAARASRVKEVRIRQVNFHDPEGEGKILSLIHNGAMNKMWGFTPLSPEEGAAVLCRLRGLYDPGLILLAERSGEPAALCLGLYPLGRSPFAGGSGRFTGRLAVLAVLPEYRFKGLETILILELTGRARSRGVSALEISQVVENNIMMNRILHNLPGVHKTGVHKIYRHMSICNNFIIKK